MSFSDKFITIFRTLLPSPLTIALILTVLTFLVAIFFGDTEGNLIEKSLIALEAWENGLWTPSLMTFAMQMMLMLVLGHVLALTETIGALIDKISKLCTDTAKAASIVTFFTFLVAFFNWGLGLVFGAVLARKVGEYATKNGIKLNYPLIGAAGYSGLMVWHGGLSGSSLSKVAEPSHLSGLMKNTLNSEILGTLPNHISYSETVFSSMNIFVSILLLIFIPLLMYFFGKKVKAKEVNIYPAKKEENINLNIIGMEKVDSSTFFSKTIGVFILLFAVYKSIIKPEHFSLNFITPNFINYTLLGLCFVFHKNIKTFLLAIDDAIGGASGILIQFPLYFGIMGIMNGTGLVNKMSHFFVDISNTTTFPIYTFFSAGIVNIFVPSGGGQWAVQGPIIIKSALELGVNIPKSILALAYGDQLTNMLQPFWALPLLGITGLKAKEILPYTLLMMIAGGIIFIIGLLIF